MITYGARRSTIHDFTTLGTARKNARANAIRRGRAIDDAMHATRAA